MFGAIIGELAAFPYELGRSVSDKEEIRVLPERGLSGPAAEGRDYSCAAVLTAAVSKGLLSFEKRIPELFGQGSGRTAEKNAFEEAFLGELEKAMRVFGNAHPLAGYPMDLSIWLFREGAALSDSEDAGPAARVSPVAFMFQDDLYMMRHMAVLQARLTHKGKETVAAADASACAVFLALHGCTKDHILGFMDRQFGYRFPGEDAVREEILQAGTEAVPALCVRAALTAFLYGKDFEDVLKRAISYGGRCGETAAIAGAVAQAYFGIPKELSAAFKTVLPGDILEAVNAFEELMEKRRQYREKNPAAKERWEGALTRGSENHPAAVRGNEPLEEAINLLNEKKDKKSLVDALEVLRHRMNEKGRFFVPLISVKRNDGAGPVNTKGQDMGQDGRQGAPDNSVLCRMQTIRTRDGKQWQPVYTSRAQLDMALRAMKKSATEENASPDKAPAPAGMVLSYSIDAFLARFLPDDGRQEDSSSGGEMQEKDAAPVRTAPPEILGIVINPYGRPFFLPRVMIRALFDADRSNKMQT